jgi:hypothetical protein
MATDKRTCDQCGASLKGKRADAIFCSTRCRVAARRKAERFARDVFSAAQVNEIQEADEARRQRERRRGPPRAPHLKQERAKHLRDQDRRQAALNRFLQAEMDQLFAKLSRLGG